jgi:uncharacterized protein (DUF58 family)
MIDASAGDPVINLSDIAEVELFIMKRMKELTLGDHASSARGPGFNFVGARDWQPADRVSSIDWAQSSLTNFSPMVTREFEQNSKATIFAVADASMSTRCGVGGVSVARAIARSVAAVGLSATLFQDSFGVVLFDEAFREIAAARPRIGRPHLLHCIDLYRQGGHGDRTGSGRLVDVIAAYLHQPSLVPVISDFLFANAPDVIRDLSRLNAVHDVFLVMADARFAYQLPSLADGWIRIGDVESGASRLISRREYGQLAARVETWQNEMLQLARAADLDLVKVGLDRWEMESTLAAFVAERRLRKI